MLLVQVFLPCIHSPLANTSVVVSIMALYLRVISINIIMIALHFDRSFLKIKLLPHDTITEIQLWIKNIKYSCEFEYYFANSSLDRVRCSSRPRLRPQRRLQVPPPPLSCRLPFNRFMLISPWRLVSLWPNYISDTNNRTFIIGLI